MFDYEALFLHVFRAVSDQGRASFNSSDTCAYRSRDGARCAVGMLIPDERYDPELEGKDFDYVVRTAVEWREPLTGPACDLLRELQHAHDDAAWERCRDFVPAFQDFARNAWRSFCCEHSLEYLPGIRKTWG